MKIIFFISYHQVNLRALLKKKTKTTTNSHGIDYYACNLSDMCAMNCSRTKFNQSSDNFFIIN